MNAPETEYESRLLERRKQADREKARNVQLGNTRLAFTLGAIALTWALAAYGFTGWPVLAVAALTVLIALLLRGDRLERRIRFATRGVQYYESALDRVRCRRNASGETGERFIDAHHPYTLDLDVFGKHSLFQFLSVCRTRAGENLLASWLMSPAAPEEIRSRHEALADMRERLDLREDLAVLGDDLRSGVHPEALVKWALAEPIQIPAHLRYIAAAFSVIGLVLLAAWTLTLFGDPKFRIAIIAVALIEAAIFFRWRAVVSHIAHHAEEPGRDLALFSAVLARIEKEQFQSARLMDQRAALDTPRQASLALAHLNRLMELLESRETWFVRIFGPLILWSTQVTFAIELWRQRHGHAIPRWVEAAAEFEAINSLAASSYEHPEDVLPEVTPGEPRFMADALAHPLLAECVANDVALGGENCLLIVSGSNMSGKSTLLRTIGLNAVLALAGAPVRAAAMRIATVSIGASIRTTDSLEGGISRFYAEILRIRQILDLAPPMLFLLDELLAGTNSHDRRIGAEAVLRGLLTRGGMGLATTHDLALSAIADAHPRVRNVHFEDFIENDRIHFDYRMRFGVVQRSNALELMRSVGLDV